MNRVIIENIDDLNSSSSTVNVSHIKRNKPGGVLQE